MHVSGGLDNPNCDRQVLICQNRTCLKQGSAAVLARFLAETLSDATVIPTGCLGQCGNGPVVLLLPEKVWLHHILLKDVSALIQKYDLRSKEP